MAGEAHLCPTLGCAIAPGVDAVSCASFGLAWGELTRRFGPLRMEPQPALADALNEPLDPSVVDPASCVAHAGFGAEGILARIEAEVREKFAGDRPRLLPSAVAPDGLVAYAFLSRALPFRTAFAERRASFGGRSVKAFGVEGSGPADRDRATQVVVHDFASPKDFVLELVPGNAGEKIVVAQMARPATLAAAVERAIARLRRLSGEDASVRASESVSVPRLAIDADGRFDDLVGRPLLNDAARGKQFDEARQTVRFSLDERGAVVRSEAALISYSAPPRSFHVTEPFLVMLLREGAPAPYLAAWVETPRWMTDQGEAPRPPLGWG